MATLLIIEDSEGQRAEIRAAVEESRVFDRVLEADDGLRGLKLLVSESVDLVLCDLEVPGIDGEKLLRMRSSGRRGLEVPFLFLSGVEDHERRARLLRGGASDSIMKPFHPADLVARLELHLKIGRLQRELIQKNEMLEQLSITDPLTGLHNRRYLAEVLPVEFLRAKRQKSGLSLVMADVDRFKEVNDQHGHAVGDSVLSGIAALLKRNIRGSDHGGRYGGEEFLMVLANAGREGALAFANRLRREVEEARFASAGDSPICVTVSFGISTIRSDHETLEQLLAEADAALYRAKRSGRNRVVATGD